MSQVAELKLEQITDPKFLLRYVNRNSAMFTELLDSIRQNGVGNSILVRPHPNGTPGLYEAVDGFYRLTCSRELGLPTIPVVIREMTDEEVLAWQIRANALRPETTKIEYARQIQRLQQCRPGVTLSEISQLVNKNPTWVKNQLDLLELDERTQQLVDSGEIPLQSAYMLAKVPRSRRNNELIAKACVLPSIQFKAVASEIIKAFMEEVRSGRLDHNYNDAPFSPVAHQRSIKKVEAEIENPYFGPQIIVAENLRTKLDVWKAALRWTLHLDTETVEAKRKAAESRPSRDLKNLYEREPDELDDLEL